MPYIDGFVLPVPKAKLEGYKEIARIAGAVWMEHGALSYVECVADDVPYGEVTSFPRSVQATEEEIVVFSWVTYQNRASRDEIIAKVMSDPRLSNDKWKEIVDGKRLIYGGFEAFLAL